jgi:hypothetical protein
MKVFAISNFFFLISSSMKINVLYMQLIILVRLVPLLCLNFFVP